MADKMISAKIDETIIEQMDKYSKDEGRTKKWIIETALKEFFKKKKTSKFKMLED